MIVIFFVNNIIITSKNIDKKHCELQLQKIKTCIDLCIYITQATPYVYYAYKKSIKLIKYNGC